MAFSKEVMKKIKEEIANDPYNVGYAGKTDAEITALLNNPVLRQKTVEYFDQAPISRIFNGIADLPNIIDPTDVSNSKKVI